MSATRRLLIAALGGEGGGVLMGWIMRAATDTGLPAQATSVPGVAQRTGATTYYIEMASAENGAEPPVFALMPVAGDVDVVLASELLEAARMAERGYVTPDRTFLLASSHRMLTTSEKMARGDGRLDAAALLRAAEAASRERFLFDADAAARGCGAPVNALLLGALAARDQLPLPAKALRRAVEAGVAPERNLRGFDAGYALARGEAQPTEDAPQSLAPPVLAESLARRVEELPEAAREVARLAVARLESYQDERYAALYLDRLAPFADDPGLMREVARHLAVRMSFEDLIRVAQLKTRASRFERIRGELGIDADEPYEVLDFFKPGLPELAGGLPPALGRALTAWAERRGLTARLYLPLRIKTTSIHGFLLVRLLSKLRPWRPRSLRWAEEQAAIEAWLALVAEARGVSPDLALATADLARLVKGYGDTHRRGEESYRRLVDELVAPALAHKSPETDPAARLREATADLLAAP